MQDLTGKVVLVTGAARGMGKLHAVNFAREGSRLVITDVDEAELARTAAEMKSKGYEVYDYKLDISDRSACFALVEKVEREVGPVDVLVNNAGITECYEILALSEASIRRMMEVNYFGTLWMIHAFAPGMIERRRGNVVNICSIAGKVGQPRMGGYCATKAALLRVTDTLRMETRGSGVTFTMINPGYVRTGMFEGAKLPFITGWQEPQRIADAVVTAVKKDQAEVCVPRFIVRLTAFMRGLCLPQLVEWTYCLLGQDKSLNNWRKDESRPFHQESARA